MSEYEINILPFNILQEQVNIGFVVKQKEGYHRTYKNDLPKNYPTEKLVEKFAWWTIDPQDGDTTISVNLFENKRFAKHYFNKILFDYFQNQDIITNRNFINDTEVYLEDILFQNEEYKKYHKFLLRVDNNDLIQGTSLLVSYNGDSFILNKSVEAAELVDISLLGKVRYQERITKFAALSETEQADRN